MNILTGWRANLIEAEVGWHILKLAMRNYHSLRVSWDVLKKLYTLKRSVLAGVRTKIVSVNNKYFHYLYAPGYPSAAFDNYIEGEFNRIVPIEKKTNALTFIFFAITKKCPLNCEHCFEWKNLNGSESLTLEQLQQVVAEFQLEGISQFHLSGGEPMVRIKDLVRLISSAGKQSEFYILTSGFNFTASNAKALKVAGVTGVVISLDHYKAALHDAFRGFNNSFDDVMLAVKNAKQNGFVITLTICITRSFVSWENLMAYVTLARELQVGFVQLLEPKPIGHYENKPVTLDAEHFAILEKFYLTMNFNKYYRDYPVIIYHGYHQRRVGCMAGGDRTLYINSEGFVNACPFCQAKNLNIKDAITKTGGVRESINSVSCQLYKKAKA